MKQVLSHTLCGDVLCGNRVRNIDKTNMNDSSIKESTAMANVQPRRRQRQWLPIQRRPFLCYLQCINLLLGQATAQVGSDTGRAPSDSPSRSVLPTIIPSFTLSMKGPWEGKLQQASEKPIAKRPIPSSIPSDMPSFTPTISHSPTASSVPSSTLRPSDGLLNQQNLDGSPSFTPSDSPSLNPSQSPSILPSFSPSSPPTGVPTKSPTSAPTATPSAGPSMFPSSAPSAAPSATPSVLPSSIPSSIPTLSCHDVAAYRSPINELTCEDHQGTDCTKWRHVGLTTDEVENLVLSCPISCNITCGSFWLSDITVPVKLKNVYTFLSPAAVDTLSTVSIEYLTEYVNDKAADPEITFYLHEVELLSQQIIQQTIPYVGRAMRYLQEDQPYVDLLLEVAYRGVAIDLDEDDLQVYLIEGIDSPGYTLALRGSGDPTFANVLVTTDIYNETVVPPKVPQKDAAGSGSIAAAVVCTLLVLGASGGLLYHFKRKSKAGMQLVQEKQSGFDSRSNNSPGSDEHQLDLRSPASSFSFEAATGYVEKLVRQIANLSPRSFTYMSENEDESRQVTSTSKSSDSTVEEHPYTGIIPPMIVIDHIDSDASHDTAERKEKKKTRKEEKVKNLVPTLHIQASSELIRALHDENEPSDPATLACYVLSNASQRQSMIMSTANMTSTQNLQDLEPPLAVADAATTERVRGSSFRVFSSDDEEEDGDGNESENDVETDDDGPMSSAISDSPVAMMETRLPTSQRASMIRPTLCDVAEESSLSSIQDPQHLFTSTPLFSDLACGNSRNFFAWPRPPRPPSESSPRSATASPILLPTSIDGEVVPVNNLSAPSEGNQSDDGEGNLLRMKHATSTGFLRSLFPTGRSAGSEHGNDREGSTPPSGELQMPPPGHTRSNSKGSSSAGTSVSEGFIYKKYQAPSKGKLGLVIECTELGPVVVKVKDYSPLLGQVQEGDRIVDVNGSKIGQTSSLQDISVLLAGRSTWTNVVKLTICRQYNSSSGGGGDNDDSFSNINADNNNNIPRRHTQNLSQASFETIPLTDSGGRVVIVSAGSVSSNPAVNVNDSPSEQQQQSQQQQQQPHPSPPFLTSSEAVARGQPITVVADMSMIDVPPLYQASTQRLSQRHMSIQPSLVDQQQEAMASSPPTRRNSSNNGNRREGGYFFSNSSFSSTTPPPLAPQQQQRPPTPTPLSPPSKAGGTW